MAKQKMKKFLITYNVLDGEHEHTNYSVAYFENYDKALKKTEIKYDESGLDDEDEEMAYGDGLTRTEVSEIQEITDEEYAVLSKLLHL
jgi:hypothetical protein